MPDEAIKNFLASQCMDYTRHLANQGHFFRFSLKMKTFSFNLDIMESRKPTSMTKKNLSPSTLARNAKRKEDFLAKKRADTSKTVAVEIHATKDSEKLKMTCQGNTHNYRRE